MEQVKLLMTELSPELTRLCAETLAAQDIAVTVCEKDGAKALAALSAEKPDAVLLDAFMPGLDALTVKQRYDEAGGGKTVFFVTGSFTDDALESEMMKKGFSFYFQKPFDPEVLAARARTAAGRHAAAQPVVDDECTVTEILHQIGVPAHIKGYQFLRDAILMTMENQDYINSVTKRLYPEIAKRNGTTASRVERAIRHAIAVSYTHLRIQRYGARGRRTAVYRRCHRRAPGGYGHRAVSYTHLDVYKRQAVSFGGMHPVHRPAAGARWHCPMTPSPVIATTWPAALYARTMRSLWAGETRA